MPKDLVNGLNEAALQAEGQRSPNLLEAYNAATGEATTAKTRVTTLETAIRAFKTAYEAATDLDDIKETAEALIALLPPR